MYLSLRIIRAIAGLIAGLYFARVPSSIKALFSLGSYNAEQQFYIGMNLIVFVLTVGAFVGLRTLINYLHNKQFSTNHPALNNHLSL
jgi:hypothetical protein